MSILAKHQSFVNEQAAFHDKMVQKVGPASFRGSLHQSTSDKFKALSADLEAADALLDAAPPTAPNPPKAYKPLQLSLSFEEVEGLPDELVAELSISDADKTEFNIGNAIEEAGGVITLDRLLIALYKKTGEIHKRATLTSKLYRMAQKNAIFNVPGKKGVYSSEQLSHEDVAKLFGTAKDDGSDLV